MSDDDDNILKVNAIFEITPSGRKVYLPAKVRICDINGHSTPIPAIYYSKIRIQSYTTPPFSMSS
jgi:hypothetical protein